MVLFDRFSFLNSNVSGGTRKNLSDNAGVLQAANIAMKQAARFKDVNKLRLNTNSKELFTATTNSIPKWKNKDWHSGNGRKVDENYKTLDGAIEKNEVRMNIEYKYLSPRKEHAHQSRADQLAVQGAQKGQKDTNAK